MILILAIPTDLYSVEEIEDVIYLKNGRRIGGKIIEKVPGDYVILELANGERSTFKYADIEKIDEETYSASPFKIKKEYTFLGMSIGSPAVFNFNIGHWFDKYGVSLSGAYWSQLGKGIQLNGGINVFNNGTISHSFMAVFGTSNMKNTIESNNSYLYSHLDEEARKKEFLEWDYMGLVYNLHYKVFFLEVGISAGSGDFPNPHLIFEGGLRFRL